MKTVLRSAARAAMALPYRLAWSLGLRRPAQPPVVYVSENADWAIKWVGENIAAHVNRMAPGTMGIVVRPHAVQGRVVHFGSQYQWVAWGGMLGPSNRYATSFFHGKREDGPDVSRHIDQFLRSVPRLGKVVTAAGIVERRLLDWGVPADKVVRIPIGTDTTLFRPTDADGRRTARQALGIPLGKVVLGSFQKDGTGWGDGMEPKLIKGPDVLLSLCGRLAREVDLMVVLTGPARGYVKAGLERLGIPYVHTYVRSHADLVACYHALDLYSVTSREEGGPMGLMESMASGVPVVSTAVGMAPDLLGVGGVGVLAASEDVGALVAGALALLAAPDRDALAARARAAVKCCDWEVVAREHLTKVYQPLQRSG